MILKYEIRGNLLLIQQYPLHLYYELRKVFTYDLIGYDRKNQKRTRTPEIVCTGFDSAGQTVDLSTTQIPKTLVTFRGYEDELLKFAIKNKLKVDKVFTQLLDESVFIPQWDNVPTDFEWRYKQREVVELISKSAGGLFVCGVGFGKSECVGVLPAIFPKARILISSYRSQVYSTIGERVRKYVLPGSRWYIQQAGKSITQQAVKQARIVVCGNKSLTKILSFGDNYDIFCSDEVHQAAAPDTFNVMSSLVRPRMFGFTGSPNRSDGAQFRLRGLFGPTLLEVDMKKATEKGLVVPIKVLWCPVTLQYDPTAGCHSAYKKHRGIWYNAVRNKLVAGAARCYDETTQVLIMVETIKHAFALKALLPEFMVVSAETKNLDRVRGAFKKGTIKKVIATGTWREGVDFPDLAVLINATGVKSEISNIQLTGRVSRLSDGKECGIVHDYYDYWNHEFKYFSAERKKIYEKQGFDQSEIQPTELLKNI